jgi:hypothetical protein
MTLKKGIIGAILGSALLAGASQAKADVVHVNARPNHVRHVQRVARPVWRSYRPAYGYRPVVTVTAPSGYGYGHGYAAPDPQNPSVVATQIRAEMNQAAEDLRFDVRQGVVESRALASLEADRQEIERDLAAASAKGYITPDDRAHLEQHVQEIRDLRTQLRCAPGGRVAYGS